MFSLAEVDELFASTTRTLQRSQVLFDERRSTALPSTALPLTFCQPTSSAASTAVGSSAAAAAYSGTNGTTAAAAGMGSSTSFTETVRSLQSLGAFRSFVEAATAMHDKVTGELQAPSAHVQQRRRRGFDFALLQSVTRGLKAATATAAVAWRTADVTAALWAGGATGDDEEGGSGDHRSSDGGVAAASTSTGAQLTATLLFGAFCVDVALTAPRAAPSIAADLLRIFAAPPSSGEERSPTGTAGEGSERTVAEWSREGNGQLRSLLEEIATLLPKSVAGHFVSRAAHLLLSPTSSSGPSRGDGALQHLGCAALSGGQFLFPTFDSCLLERYPATLAVRWFVKPLQTAAQNLRADYYRSATAFAAQCRWMLELVFVLVRACQTAAAAAVVDDASPPLSSSAQTAAGRHVRVAQRVYDAWLMPLEKTFGHDAARHGMPALFHTHLVVPHAQLMQHLQLQQRQGASGKRSSDGVSTLRGTRAWSSIVHTAQYRLLLVLERLAQSEVAQAQGTSTTAARQRTYEALLRQNGGKVSVSLLQTLAEDKQLVLEETPSRSPDGHRLYRLHDGMADGASSGAKAVFVYVDDGAFFTKVGRSRVFQRVKSVDDIFRPLQ